MIKALILLAILVAGFIAGPLLAGQTGYVLIVIAGYQIETSVVVLVLAIVLTLLLIWLLDWLIKKILSATRKSSRWAATRRAKKAKQLFKQSLEAFTAGAYEKSQELASRAAKYAEDPTPAWLLSASSAQQLHDAQSEHRFLTNASSADESSIALAMLDAHHLPPAQGTTAWDKLVSENPEHGGVTRGAAQYFYQHRLADRLFRLLPALERDRALSATTLHDYKTAAAKGYFAAAVDNDGLQKKWRQLSKSERNQPLMRLAYTAALAQAGQPAAAQDVLIKGLRRGSLTPTQLLYSPFTHNWQSFSELTRYIETYIKKASDDADALAFFAVLSRQQGDPELAEKALRAALKVHERPFYYQLLGDIALATGNAHTALEAYQKAWPNLTQH